MPFTPAEIAQADQTLAGVGEQLGKLVQLVSDDPGSIEDVDEVADILLSQMGHEEACVALAVAVYKLARHQ